MIKTINIERQAFGSKADFIGDNTLFYSADCSDHVIDVRGQFEDNPSRLSPHHASLVWRYNADVDNYLLIHVQGSHVISESKGRQYTFRAGYEVSREDMNTIGFHLTALFQAMPKMENMQSGRVEAKAEVDTSFHYNVSPSDCLASHLLKAVMDSQPLYISLDGNIEGLKNDGIFESLELKILLATIDSIPVDKRRYVTFGFCVDDHYASVLEDVPIIIYLKDSQLTIPQEVCNLSWKEATTVPASQPLLKVGQKWWGADEPLLSREQLAVMRKTVNGTDSLVGEEWSIWTSLGHKLTELKVDAWADFFRLYKQMDENTRVQLIDTVKDTDLSWTLEEVMKTIVLVREKKSHPLEDEYVRKIDKKTLSGLLRSEPSSLIDNVEQLLDVSEHLSKKWKSYFDETLLPATMCALQTDDNHFRGPLSKSRTNELMAEESYYWELEANYPLVFATVQQKLTAFRQKCYEETIRNAQKDSKSKGNNSKKSFSKYLWALLGLFLGLILGGIATYWFLTGNIAFNF